MSECCANPNVQYDALHSTKDLAVHVCRTCGDVTYQNEDCGAGG